MKPEPAKPEALIEAYVIDVIRRLPRKQRNDVGFELRALLTEGLKGRAEAGRDADEAMALELVREFGQPEEVAARYHAPGAPIIPPMQTRPFVWTTVIGVGLQWTVSLPLMLSGELPLAGPEDSRFAAWWLTYGLGALWWPGFLVCVMMVAAWVRQAWPAGIAEWKPRRGFDPDHVNRGLYVIGLVAALNGIALWVLIAWSVATFNNGFTRALAFGNDFLATRAPLLLIYWAAAIALLILVIIEGRWRVLTRTIDLGLKLAGSFLMAWFAFGGRIFVSDPADQTTKSVLVLLIVVILGQLAFDAWRARAKIRPPQAQRG